MKNYPTNKLKILNDPIYGFIRIPNSLIFDIIEHPSFQRLRRVSQMGFSNLVYPGANHTRFHHALGCLHLMQKTVNVLRFKGINISEDEENALYIAILLHDIGHGAFSHALEHSIVTGITHEEISLKYMHQLNKEFDGQLDLAISVFNGEYHRKFLHQLITSQLDIDRLDYLKRDSFYTGVAEGNINSERLITMLNVINDQLVIEEKGIYSIEKFLIARRFMYWQVYLHKTGLAAEQLLIRVLKRAKELTKLAVNLEASLPLTYFLKNDIDTSNFDDESLEIFSRLDDYDIVAAMKSWQYHEDFVLRNLCDIIINRDLLSVKLKNKPMDKSILKSRKDALINEYNIYESEANYFVFSGKITNQAYKKSKEQINILFKNGKVKNIIKASDQLNLKALSKPITKYYICYP